MLVEAGLEPVFKDDGLYTEEVLGLDALVEKGSEDWPYEEELYVRLAFSESLTCPHWVGLTFPCCYFIGCFHCISSFLRVQT